jgi:hypothetical protein
VTRAAVRRGSFAGVLVRVVVITVAGMVLGLALGGLLGIIVLATLNATGVPENMAAALYSYGVPGAVIGGIAGFAVIVWSERKARAAADSSGPEFGR